MELEAKRQALETLVAPRQLIVEAPELGVETRELIEIAHKGILGSPRSTAPTADALTESLWAELVENLPDDAHIRVASRSKGKSIRVRWSGTDWHELTELEFARYNEGR